MASSVGETLSDNEVRNVKYLSSSVIVISRLTSALTFLPHLPLRSIQDVADPQSPDQLHISNGLPVTEIYTRIHLKYIDLLNCLLTDFLLETQLCNLPILACPCVDSENQNLHNE